MRQNQFTQLILFAVSLSTSQFSHADLTVCNKGDGTINIAFSSAQDPQGNKYHSNGWFIINAGECNSFVEPTLNAGHFYYHAIDEIGNEFGSQSSTRDLCITENKFSYSYSGNHTCPDANMSVKAFNRVETSGNSDFTLNLTGSSKMTAELRLLRQQQMQQLQMQNFQMQMNQLDQMNQIMQESTMRSINMISQ